MYLYLAWLVRTMNWDLATAYDCLYSYLQQSGPKEDLDYLQRYINQVEYPLAMTDERYEKFIHYCQKRRNQP